MLDQGKGGFASLRRSHQRRKETHRKVCLFSGVVEPNVSNSVENSSISVSQSTPQAELIFQSFPDLSTDPFRTRILRIRFYRQLGMGSRTAQRIIAHPRILKFVCNAYPIHCRPIAELPILREFFQSFQRKFQHLCRIIAAAFQCFHPLLLQHFAPLAKLQKLVCCGSQSPGQRYCHGNVR